MSPRSKGYIGAGDIVNVVRIEGGGTIGEEATGNPKYLGMTGMVAYNNSWGLCTVRFLDGDEARFWNSASLEYASDKESEEFRKALP